MFHLCVVSEVFASDMNVRAHPTEGCLEHPVRETGGRTPLSGSVQVLSSSVTLHNF